MGMLGFDRGGRRRLQAEPPSLVKGAPALTANKNNSVQAFRPMALAA
jgi:hypothetical protein